MVIRAVGEGGRQSGEEKVTQVGELEREGRGVQESLSQESLYKTVSGVQQTSSTALTNTTTPSPNAPRPRTITLYPATTITTSSHALRFTGAAYSQIQILPQPTSPSPEGPNPEVPNPEDPDQDQLLITSPYNYPLHLLNLRTLDWQFRLLSLALTTLQPVRDDYATAHYLSSFNWSTVLSTLRSLAEIEGYEWRERGFYTVVFRSRLREGVDKGRLGDLDREAHGEAVEGGGLLKYWFGDGDEGGFNLATCIWRSREDAIRGGAGPWHAKAMRASVEMYEFIGFKRYDLIFEDGGLGVRMVEL